MHAHLLVRADFLGPLNLKGSNAPERAAELQAVTASDRPAAEVIAFLAITIGMVIFGLSSDR